MIVWRTALQAKFVGAGTYVISVCLDRSKKTKEAGAERKERRDAVTVATKASPNVQTVESLGMSGIHV